MKNYYEILEIWPTATLEQIKSQHELLLEAWNPNKFSSSESIDKANDKINNINEAYEVLSDPLKRVQYDHNFESFSSPKAKSSNSQSRLNSYNSTFKQNCQNCGLPSETKYAKFYENVGMLVVRKYRSVKGNFCKNCIDYYFWNFTGKTMLLGWWGLISFIVTPFIILNNLFQFLFSYDIKKPTVQITPSPSPLWIFSTIFGFLIIILVLIFLFS